MKKSVPPNLKDYKNKKDDHYDWMHLIQRLTLKPIIELDETSGNYRITDPAVEKYLAIVTNGEAKWIRYFFNRMGRFRINALRDSDGRVRMFLLAYALERALQGDIAWGKFTLDLIDKLDKVYTLRKNENKAKLTKYRKRGRPRKDEWSEEEETGIGDERAIADLQGMGGESEGDEIEEEAGFGDERAIADLQGMGGESEGDEIKEPDGT